MTFEYENLLLLKSPQNNVAPNKKKYISYMPEAIWDKFNDLIDEPVVQCYVPVVKNTLYLIMIIKITNTF